MESRVLVVNAAYERAIIQEAYTRATALGATHVVFTHVDELPRCGKLWEFVLDDGLVPLFASTGQNIAGDYDRHVIDLLVRRIAARLAGLGSGERLVGGRLRAVGSRGGRGGGAVGGICRALGSGNLRLQARDLSLQAVDLRLQRLEIGAARQTGQGNDSSHLDDDRSLHGDNPL